jgi:hypothetical protein
MTYDLTWVGVGLLIAGGLAIVVEAALAAVWGLRVGRAARRLAERLQSERGLVESDIKALRSAIEETKRLWRPYARVMRWLRHPLVVALLQSYSRRRAAAR